MQIMSTHETDIGEKKSFARQSDYLNWSTSFLKTAFSDAAVVATYVRFFECAVTYNMGMGRLQEKKR